jgi:hypothetical protein
MRKEFSAGVDFLVNDFVDRGVRRIISKKL